MPVRTGVREKLGFAGHKQFDEREAVIATAFVRAIWMHRALLEPNHVLAQE